MIIQLINPPQVFSSQGFQATNVSMPIGLAYIAAVSRNAGHQVSFIDALAEAPQQFIPMGKVTSHGLSQAQILDRIKPDTQVLGITCMCSANWIVLKPIIQEIKARFPDKIIVCGGEHFSGLPEYSMQHVPIDFIVMGEGESTIVTLLDRLQNHISPDFSAIPGLCWRDHSGAIVRNCAVKAIRDVNTLPWPAWDLVDTESYFTENLCTTVNVGTRTIPILATRGCPYECTYCSSPGMWTRRWYPRDPIQVVDEIEYYVKTYQADHFPLQDLTPLMKKDWIKTFAGEIIRRGLKIKWQTLSGTRYEIIDEEILRIIKESGCDTLNYAPETGSDRLRESVKKYMKMDRLLQAVEWTIKENINLGIFIVLALPDEREEDIRETVRFVRKLARLGVVDITPSFFTPIPGTVLFDELVAEGRLELNDETLMIPTFVFDMWLTKERNMCRHMSAAKLSFYRWWVVLNFYVTSWINYPHRLFRVIVNVFQDRDATKLTKALNVVKKRYLGKLLFRRQSTQC